MLACIVDGEGDEGVDGEGHDEVEVQVMKWRVRLN